MLVRKILTNFFRISQDNRKDIEIYAPLKKVSRKQRKIQAKRWITKEL